MTTKKRQWILEHTPALPVGVLQAQQESRLVLLCGAGVSARAGYPLFGQLVEELYEQLPNYHRTQAEKDAIELHD